jgi:hypothetical protein
MTAKQINFLGKFARIAATRENRRFRSIDSALLDLKRPEQTSVRGVSLFGLLAEWHRAWL